MTRVNVLLFARVAELLGSRYESLELQPGARADDVWTKLTARAPELRALEASTRVARNGRIVRLDEPLEDGDELAFLPPVGGG